MVGQPGEFYLIHTSPNSGTGLSIATSIYNEIKDTDLADKLNVIGSDGTAAMTGAHNGTIRNREESLHKPAPVQQFFAVSNSSIMSSCHSSSSITSNNIELIGQVGVFDFIINACGNA